MKQKKFFILCLVFCAGIFFTACNKSAVDADSPSVVVTRFVKAFAECNLIEAQKDAYGTLNKTLADGAEKHKSESAKEAWRAKLGGKFDKIKIVDEKIDEDSAVVTATNGSQQSEFYLVKVNGEWKITGMR